MSKYKRVVFSGMGVHEPNLNPKFGQCCFDGTGKTTAPVNEIEDTDLAMRQTIESDEEITAAKAKEVKKAPKEVSPLTKSDLKKLIENKFVANKMEYTPELHRKISGLNRDPLEAYLNDESNFVPEATKELDRDAEQKKAQAEKDAKEEVKEEPKMTEEEAKEKMIKDAKDKAAIIAKILELQVSKKEEEPMTEEELKEMSPESLTDYLSELSA